MFGADNEIMSLSVLAKDEDTFADYRGDVRDYLSYGPVKAIFQLLDSTYTKLHRLPTRRELQVLLERSAVKGEWSALFRAQVSKVFEALAEPHTPVSEQIVTELIKEKRLKDFKNNLYELNTTTGLSQINSLIEYLQETQEINVELSGDGFFEPFSDEYIDNPIERLLEELGDPISSGFQAIDERTKGLRKKETVLIIAPTGVGKTQFKQQLALNMANAGNKVLYLFNDNTKGEILMRLWANQCNTDTEEDRTSSVFSQQLYNSRGGLYRNLTCREIFPGKTNVKDVANLIRKARKRLRGLDAVVLDYSDLLAPLKDYQGSESRQAAKEIIDSLAALAKTENVLMVTSTQSNRGGLNATILSLENLSEAFSKAFVCAHVWTLTQSMAEKEMGILTMASVKSRRKVSLYAVPMNQCPNSMRITQNTILPVVSLFEAIQARQAGQIGPRRRRNVVDTDE